MAKSWCHASSKSSLNHIDRIEWLSGNVLLQEFPLWLIWFLGWTAPESASSFDQQLQSVKKYTSIKNTMGSQEHHKSAFVAKCLSSLQNMCNVDGFRFLGPLSILMQKGPFQGGFILVRFIFWTPKNKFSHPLVCGRVWLMALSCWCIGWAAGSREAFHRGRTSGGCDQSDHTCQTVRHLEWFGRIEIQQLQAVNVRFLKS